MEARISKNTSISLGDHFSGFIADQIAKGRYGSASEVVREGLRLIEERARKLDALEQALAAGEASGISELSGEDIIREARARHQPE